MDRIGIKGILNVMSGDVKRFIILFGISFVFQAILNLILADQFEFWKIVGQAILHPILATILGYILFNMIEAGNKGNFSKSKGTPTGTINIIYTIQLLGFVLQYYTPY